MSSIVGYQRSIGSSIYALFIDLFSSIFQVAFVRWSYRTSIVSHKAKFPMSNMTRPLAKRGQLFALMRATSSLAWRRAGPAATVSYDGGRLPVFYWQESECISDKFGRFGVIAVVTLKNVSKTGCGRTSCEAVVTNLPIVLRLLKSRTTSEEMLGLVNPKDNYRYSIICAFLAKAFNIM